MADQEPCHRDGVGGAAVPPAWISKSRRAFFNSAILVSRSTSECEAQRKLHEARLSQRRNVSAEF